MHLDFVVHMPLPGSKFNLIAGLGIGKVKIKADEDIEFTIVDGSDARMSNKLAYRVKVGAEYNFNDNFSLRGLLSYQILNNKLHSLT